MPDTTEIRRLLDDHDLDDALTQTELAAARQTAADANARAQAAALEAQSAVEQLAVAKRELAASDAEVARLRAKYEPTNPPVDPPDPEPITGLDVIRRPPTGKMFMGSTNTSGVTQHHTIVGKRAQFHHAYSRSAAELKTRLDAVPDGMVPFLNCKPLGNMGGPAYQAIIDGDADTALTAIAGHCRTYGKPMVVAWLHEPENNDKVASSYARTDRLYAQAFRYIVEYLRRSGVTNVLHGWNMMAFAEWMPRYDALYPGSDVVDIIMGDPYSHVATQTLATLGVPTGAAQKFHDWAAKHGKPIWWAEWGIDKPSAATNAARMLTAAGLADLQRKQPLVVGLVYWNEWLAEAKAANDATKDYRLSNFPAAWKAFASLPAFDVDVSTVAK